MARNLFKVTETVLSWNPDPAGCKTNVPNHFVTLTLRALPVTVDPPVNGAKGGHCLQPQQRSSGC